VAILGKRLGPKANLIKMFNNPQFHSIFGLKYLAGDPQEIEIIM
jgi:hypothetical protein